MVDFLHQVSIWLVNHMVWLQKGNWLGPQDSHAPRVLLAKISPEAYCPCGSGRAYRKCHMPEHQQSVNPKSQ